MRLRRSFRFYRLLILTTLLFSWNALWSQSSTLHWYFGDRAALNFNTTPVSILQDNVTLSYEGSAAISDVNGNLMFYTNGVSVRNQLHEVMDNGGGILGDQSSTNNTLIIPLPGNDSLYYLFTIGAEGQDAKGFRYNIINARANNGLGKVVLKNELIQLNCFEKLAAVRHCNKKDYWITVKNWNSDSYSSYLFSASGVSKLGIIGQGAVNIGGQGSNALGVLKFSPDGRKLVAQHSFQNNLVELMDFDPLSGEISNAFTFRPNIGSISPIYTGVYGAEFSRDGRYLYISTSLSASVRTAIYQYDVSLPTEAAIIASGTLIFSTDIGNAGSLQASPDGKIYCAINNTRSLSVINNPTVQGAGCNFIFNQVLVANTGTPVQYGLPTFVAGTMYNEFALLNFTTSGNCTQQTITFQPTVSSTIDSLKWEFGDGTVSDEFTPTHHYTNIGEYLVKLTIYRNTCSSNSETIARTILVGKQAFKILRNDSSVCKFTAFELSSLYTAASYQWSNGSTDKSIQISSPGSYWLQILKDGCVYRDTFNIVQDSILLNFSLGNDTTVCSNNPFFIGATTNMDSYLWNTGEQTKKIEINKPGLYQLTAVLNGCTYSDSVKISNGDCGIFIPQAFSPNNDGLNETFGLVNGLNTEIFSFSIFNRYGQLIYFSKNSFEKWNGRIQGKPAPVGAYVWMMTYKNRAGFIQTDKGTVMLIR